MYLFFQRIFTIFKLLPRRCSSVLAAAERPSWPSSPATSVCLVLKRREALPRGLITARWKGPSSSFFPPPVFVQLYSSSRLRLLHPAASHSHFLSFVSCIFPHLPSTPLVLCSRQIGSSSRIPVMFPYSSPPLFEHAQAGHHVCSAGVRGSVPTAVRQAPIRQHLRPGRARAQDLSP